MHLFRTIVLAAALLAASVTSARADGFISPMLGFKFGGDSANCPSLTNCEDKRLSWGVSIGKTSGGIGFEEDIAYMPDFFGKTPGVDNAMLTLMSNLMIIIPAGPVRPYGLVGLGLMRPHATFGSSTLTLGKNTLGWDFGGGINIFLTHGFGLRGDIRRMRTLQDVTLGVFSNDQIDFWRGSAGVTFQF
jgi:hypothetical protein